MNVNTSMKPGDGVSPFCRNAQHYIDNGLPVVPIAPHTKKPGELVGGKWIGMSDWTKYGQQMPTEQELELWCEWLDAGIGLLCGRLANVIGIDVDTDNAEILKKLAAILPGTFVKKKGKKGYTGFYRYNGEKSMSWKANGETIVDLLSDGRQTLMPGTVHPAGMTYTWLTEDTLVDFDVAKLPTLPDAFVELMNELVAPLQTDEDREHARMHNDQPHDAGGDNVPVGFAAAHFREINNQALIRLDEWVPRMIPTAKATAIGYRCKAFWRGGEGLNVGVTTSGIRDFVGDYGMTAIDLVMHAQNVPFQQAAEALRQALNIGIGDNPLAPSQPKEDCDQSGPKSVTTLAVMPIDMPPPPAIAAAREPETDDQDKRDGGVKVVPDFILQAPGVLGRIAGWMAQTAPKYQPELFVAAAIAVGATAMGRLYRTNFGNWPSQFIALVAKSGEGKEHPMQSAVKLLSEAGLDSLIAGSGYTSTGAVFSALLRSPSHLAVIDEMGKKLKFTRQQGAAHAEAAIDTLVEGFSKVDGLMKPPIYSTMSMNATHRAAQPDWVVHNPAITLLGATTPATFYEALTNDLIRDGFLGRLIAVISSQPRQENDPKVQTPPPDDLVKWVQEIHQEGAKQNLSYMNHALRAKAVMMVFDEEATGLLAAFERDLTTQWKPLFDEDGNDVLLTRTREKAMRLAMVVAKATNARGDNTIHGPAVKWSLQYVLHYDLQMIRAVQSERVETEAERKIKKIVDLVHRAKVLPDKEFGHVTALGGMPRAKLLRASKLDKREFDLITETAIEQGLIAKSDGAPSVGYAGTVYWPRKAA